MSELTHHSSLSLRNDKDGVHASDNADHSRDVPAARSIEAGGTQAIISVAGLDDQAICVRALQTWEKGCPETETLTTSEQPSRRKLLSSNLLLTERVFIYCKGERSFS